MPTKVMLSNTRTGVYHLIGNCNSGGIFITAPGLAGHAVRAVIDEALQAKEGGEERVILFNLCGHGHFDMLAYDAYFTGQLQDYEYPADAVAAAQEKLPQVV